MEIKDVVLKLRPRDIVDLSPAVITKMALLRSKKIEELLTTYLGGKKIEEVHYIKHSQRHRNYIFYLADVLFGIF